jgi:predicted permease
MSWRRFLRRAKSDRERLEELRSYIQIETDANIARGMSREAARQAACRKLGNRTQIREEIYRMNTIGFLDTLWRDLRHAARGLRQAPTFTAVAVLTLALGIGANTAIFSVVNTFLLRSLPYPEPDRLVALFERNVMNNEQTMGLAAGNFLDWQKLSTSFENMGAYNYRVSTFSSDGAEADRVVACNCSATLLAALGVPPVAGRLFRPDEDKFNGPRVVVLSYAFWQKKFGGSPNVIGKSIRLDGNSFEVIGVMPRSFVFPQRLIDLWRPFLTNLPPELQIRHDMHNLQAVARLKRGVSIEQARADLDAIAARYKSEHPNEATGRGANVLPLHGRIVSDARAPLIILLGAVSCVLLIACVNIAALVLTRASGRTREIGIRAALGAGRGRIIRQLVTESTLLALAGGALGVVLAVSVTGVLAANAPAADFLLPAGNVPVDPVVFLFAFGVAVIAGIGVGLVPAIQVSRADLINDLKSGGRNATATRSHARLRNTLVAGEVALSVVLLIASGLLLRSFFALYQVQPGVRLENSLSMSISAPLADYREPGRRVALLNEITDRLQSVPGVRSVGLTSCPPLTGDCNTLFYYVDGRPFVRGKFLIAAEKAVDPRYFTTAGIPLLQGRTFTGQDGVGADLKNPKPGAIVISEFMAKTVFPGENPIGKRIFFDYEVQRGEVQNLPVPKYEVVGVVGDVRPTIDTQVAPALYRPALDQAPAGTSIILHTIVEPKSVIAAVREEIRRIDSGIAVYRIQTVEELVGISVAARQFNMLLLAVFAGLALLLAAIGLYGLVSHTVSLRKAEIGVRMALGATSLDVNRMVLAQGLKPALAGLAIGLVAAAFACQLLRSQLFGISLADPLSFGLAPLLLLAVAMGACYLPAVRATRLDPTDALRAE